MGCCCSSPRNEDHRPSKTKTAHLPSLKSKSDSSGVTSQTSDMADKKHSYLGLSAFETPYAPPPGPPPGYNQHDWESAVPDTSLLPPPPMLGYDVSHTNNATADQADQAIAWCARNQLSRPITLAPQGRETVEAGVFGLSLPPNFSGAREASRGNFAVSTRRGTPDTCMTSGLPMYCVNIHSPLITGKPKTIYFEVKMGRTYNEIDCGLGFLAAPYPPFRLPGWERGSLGIHGDDGHRYINDKWGGRDCTDPFKPGETIGIGMIFTARNRNAPPVYGSEPLPQNILQQTPINVEVFFTRDGKRAGGWNLHEEKDSAQEMPVTGLEGLHDLYASVGMFEGNEFEIVFNEQNWLYQLH